MRNSSVSALTPKGRATRERIVDAAARLSYERGVAGTSLEDIRLASGASGSQISHYFRDKADLMLAVIEKQTEAVVGNQEPLFETIDDIAGLRRWRDFAVDFQRSAKCMAPCPITTLASELAGSDVARLDLAASFARWTGGLRTGLSAMQKRGILSPSADVDRLAYALLAAFQGGVLLTTTLREIEPLESALDTVIDRIETMAAEYRAERKKKAAP